MKQFHDKELIANGIDQIHSKRPFVRVLLVAIRGTCIEVWHPFPSLERYSIWRLAPYCSINSTMSGLLEVYISGADRATSIAPSWMENRTDKDGLLLKYQMGSLLPV